MSFGVFYQGSEDIFKEYMLICLHAYLVLPECHDTNKEILFFLVGKYI